LLGESSALSNISFPFSLDGSPTQDGISFPVSLETAKTKSEIAVSVLSEASITTLSSSLSHSHSQSPSEAGQQSGDPTVAVIVGIVVGVLALITVVVVVIVYRMRAHYISYYSNSQRPECPTEMPSAIMTDAICLTFVNDATIEGTTLWVDDPDEVSQSCINSLR
jgi:hypothetical protein